MEARFEAAKTQTKADGVKDYALLKLLKGEVRRKRLEYQKEIVVGFNIEKTFLLLCDFYPVNKRQLHDFLYLLLLFVFVFCFLVFFILFRWKSSAC